MTNQTEEIKKSIFNTKNSFEALLPKKFDVNKFMATLFLEIQKNPKLASCSNVIEVAKDVANFGLIVGGLAGQSYIIPFKDQAKLIIGYKGYITKLEEAGYFVEAEIVTKEEIEKGCFQEIRGSETKIIHNPIRSGIRDRENIALAYCIIKHKDNPPVISVLSKEEIEEIAKTEKWIDGKKTRELGNVWVQNQRLTDYGQMCVKTAIRNAVKRVNLKVVNEMSAYEGERDQQILKNVTPVSKTANAHEIPQNLINSFSNKESKTDNTIDVEPEFVNEDALEQAFERVKTGLNSMKSIKAVNTYFEIAAKDDLDFIKNNNQSYYAELLSIKSKKIDEIKI